MNKGNQDQNDLDRRKKTKISAQTAAFTCYLIYFLVKAIVILVLIKYDNFLKHHPLFIIPFVLLLIINTYLMITTGKDPGFQVTKQQQAENLVNHQNNLTYCKICECTIKNRAKHCYKCGKCVRKFDHHCPWIGSCVGQKNHFKFLCLLLAHTCQASFAFLICFKSMSLYQYAFKDGTFSSQYGVFCIFSLFMLFYIIFAGALLCYHAYLILNNLTTREMMERGKCHYLKNLKYNPFDRGIYENLKMAMFPSSQGNFWLFQINQNERYQSFWSKIWKNDYYECC